MVLWLSMFGLLAMCRASSVPAALRPKRKNGDFSPLQTKLAGGGAVGRTLRAAVVGILQKIVSVVGVVLSYFHISGFNGFVFWVFWGDDNCKAPCFTRIKTIMPNQRDRGYIALSECTGLKKLQARK